MIEVREVWGNGRGDSIVAAFCFSNRGTPMLIDITIFLQGRPLSRETWDAQRHGSEFLGAKRALLRDFWREAHGFRLTHSEEEITCDGIVPDNGGYPCDNEPEPGEALCATCREREGLDGI